MMMVHSLLSVQQKRAGRVHAPPALHSSLYIYYNTSLLSLCIIIYYILPFLYLLSFFFLYSLRVCSFLFYYIILLLYKKAMRKSNSECEHRLFYNL